jgi:hypothetical protein
MLTTQRTQSRESGLCPIPPATTAMHATLASMLFDLGDPFVPAARGTSGKRFVVRIYALTDGNDLAFADSKPVTLLYARKLEVRARKSDALDVEVCPADDVPPAIEGALRISELRGMSITVDPDLFSRLKLSPPAPASESGGSLPDVPGKE